MRLQSIATTAALFSVIGASVIRREIADGAKVTLIADGDDCKLKVENLQGCTGISETVGKKQDNRCIGGEAKPIPVCGGKIDIHFDESKSDSAHHNTEHEVILDGETDWIPGDVFYNLNGTRGYVHVGIGIDCSNEYHSKGLWGGGCM